MMKSVDYRMAELPHPYQYCIQAREGREAVSMDWGLLFSGLLGQRWAP